MPRILLCPPKFFCIEYEINPWMSRSRNADRASACRQWEKLKETLTDCGVQLDFVEPVEGLPDMVFTANAGLVVGNRFIESNFHFPERQNESPHFEKWFQDHGFEVVRCPSAISFEGEGDALFCGQTLFCGYRFRSDIRAHRWLSDLLQCLVISVELVDPRWYHLDTCFCPLNATTAIWYPEAFDSYAQQSIRLHIPNLIPLPLEEALKFGCNSVIVGSHALVPAGCPHLERSFLGEGFQVHPLEMTEFMKAGGACKCLTLFLAR